MMKKTTSRYLLKSARETRGWSQRYIAEQLEAPAPSYVSRWERGTTTPSPYYREKLCALFNMNTYELGLLDYSDPAHHEDSHDIEDVTEQSDKEIQRATLLWNVPHHRNPFFTGREHIFAHLDTGIAASKETKSISLFVLCGLPGIGKTQTAVEYAYRSRDNYQAIFWVHADSPQTLAADFIAIAQLLQLPQREEPDINQVVMAVKNWLAQETRWLLILDNVNDVEMIYRFLPQTGNGDILFTTNTQATGPLASNLVLEQMSLEEGMTFLLQRAKLILDEKLDQVSDDNHQAAQQIVQFVGGLPLALDQIGAYIEETSCPITEYLDLYHRYRTQLLQRRGRLAMEHSESVVTTLMLCVKKVQQNNPAAIDLLHLCAFLHSEAIPEELFIENVEGIGPFLQDLIDNPLLLNEIFGELLQYSFIRRDPLTRTFTVHCLIQTILQDHLDVEARRTRATWIVKAIGKAFPSGDFSTWPVCQRYLQHIHVSARFIAEYHLYFPEAARLLYRSGCYYLQRADYESAEHFLQQALLIHEQIWGAEHFDTAACFHKLATLHLLRGKTDQGEAHLQRVLLIYEHSCEPEHTLIAECLDDLAMFYYYQKKYALAEQFCQRAVTIWKKTLEGNNSNIASGLNNLAKIYLAQGKSDQAAPLLQRSLTTLERVQGPRHPDVAFALENLARLYQSQGRYALAESHYKRAITIREEALGKNHPRLAESLQGLASLYLARKKYAQAEVFYKDALAIQEYALGLDHPQVNSTLQMVTKLYTAWGRHKQAEVYRQKLLVN